MNMSAFVQKTTTSKTSFKSAHTSCLPPIPTIRRKIWLEIISSLIYSSHSKDSSFTSNRNSSCSSKFYRNLRMDRGCVTSYTKRPDFNLISDQGRRLCNPSFNNRGSYRTWSKVRIWYRKWNYNFRGRPQVVSQDHYLALNPQCKLLVWRRPNTDKQTVAWKYSKVHICSLDHSTATRKRQLPVAQWLNNVATSIWKMISFARARLKMTTWSSINSA